jgi:hypothetical protein
MRTRTLVLLSVTVVLAAIVLAGCSGTVSGIVTSKAQGAPLAGATVTIGGLSAKTSSDGHFSLAKVPTGKATMQVGKHGFAPVTLPVEVKKTTGPITVTLEDGILSGKVSENAVVVQAIKKATVKCRDSTAVVAADGTFTLVGVPIGPCTVEISAPGHEPFAATVDVAAGDNNLTARLSLTPQETYMRYYLAYRFNRFREAYRFVHPDVRKHYSYARFVKDMSSTITVSIKFFGSQTLSKWAPAFAHKTYRHIVVIDRAVVSQDAFGRRYTDNYSQHWQKIKGRWYIIFDWSQ